MKNRSSSLLVVVLLAFCVPAAAQQQAPPWPDRWLAAGSDFGNLRVAYRLTDDCQIDPDFEIIESPNLDVTNEEILESLTGFLANGTRDDIPRDVLMAVMEGVFGQQDVPARPMTKGEYDQMVSEFERLGPWPQIRFAPVGTSTFRCSFDVAGGLVRVERSDAGKDLFTDVDRALSDQGPFFLRWYIEE